MEGSFIFIVLATSVAFASAATTMNPITDMTGMTTDIVTDFGTTIIDNSTSLPSTQASSTEPQPTPCAEATWMVRQPDGNICQLMSFTGTITYQGPDKPVTVDIPENASIENSGCTENAALFMLTFPSGNYRWQIQLSFNVEDSKYYLGRVYFELMTLEGGKIDDQNEEKEFFSVPVGKHYTCNKLDFILKNVEIDLVNPVFQPFVQRTTDGCGLGEAHKCGSGDGSTGSNTGLIVGCVIAGVAAVALGGVTFYVIRKRKRTDYSNIR